MATSDSDATGTAAAAVIAAARSGADGYDPDALKHHADGVVDQLDRMDPATVAELQASLDITNPDINKRTRLAVDEAARIAIRVIASQPKLFDFIAYELRAGDHGRDCRVVVNPRFYCHLLLTATLSGELPRVTSLVNVCFQLRDMGHSRLLEDLGCPRYKEVHTRPRQLPGKARRENRSEFRQRARRLVDINRFHIDRIHKRANTLWEQPVSFDQLQRLGLELTPTEQQHGQPTFGEIVGLAFMQATFAVDDQEHRSEVAAIDETVIQAYTTQRKHHLPYCDGDAKIRIRTQTPDDRRKFLYGYSAQAVAYTGHVTTANTRRDGDRTGAVGAVSFTGRKEHPTGSAARMTALVNAVHRRDTIKPIKRLVLDRGYTHALPHRFARLLNQTGIDIVAPAYEWLHKLVEIGDTGYAFLHGRLYQTAQLPHLRELGLSNLPRPETAAYRAKNKLEEDTARRLQDTEPDSREHAKIVARHDAKLAKIEADIAALNDKHAHAADLAWRYREHRYTEDDQGNKTAVGIVYQGPAAGKTRTAACPNHNPRDTKAGQPLPGTGCGPARHCPHRNLQTCLAKGGCYHPPHNPDHPELLGPTNPDDCAHEHGTCQHPPQCWRTRCNCAGTFYIPLINPVEQLAATTPEQREAARTATPYETKSGTRIHITDPATGKQRRQTSNSPIVERLLGRLTPGSDAWRIQLGQRNHSESPFGLAKGVLNQNLRHCAIQARGAGAFGLHAIATFAANQILILLNNRVTRGEPRTPWPNDRAELLLERTRSALTHLTNNLPQPAPTDTIHPAPGPEPPPNTS